MCERLRIDIVHEIDGFSILFSGSYLARKFYYYLPGETPENCPRTRERAEAYADGLAAGLKSAAHIAAYHTKPERTTYDATAWQKSS
jgi:hypothetical protein